VLELVLARGKQQPVEMNGIGAGRERLLPERIGCSLEPLEQLEARVAETTQDVLGGTIGRRGVPR
jgi:hypothetical protein